MMQQAGFAARDQNPLPVHNPMNTRLGKRDEDLTAPHQPLPPSGSRPQRPPSGGRVAADRNPFDTLGIPRGTTDEQVVNEVYRKWVTSLHPDRGGDPRRFQEINRAYKMVLEVIQHAKNESFEMLKRQAERDMAAPIGGFHTGNKDGQANQALAPLGHGEAFNHARFNEVFQNHRMWTPEDDGYGDRMVASEYGNEKKLRPEELIHQRERDFLGVPQQHDPDLLHKFNDNQFNALFEQRAHTQEPHRPRRGGGGETSMVVRTEPEEMGLFRNSTSLCTTLSVDKVDDFSSPFLGTGAGSSGGAYTDYMRAFSRDALITPHVSDAQVGPKKSVKDLERERANISFIPSQELLQDRARQEASIKEQDELRWRNFLKHQEQVEAHNQAVRNVLSDVSSVPPRRNI